MLLAPLALAAETGVPARTRARIVARHSLPRLADIDRVTGEVRRRGPVTAVRYERERPGELVHVDVKKVARIPDGGGHRALGRGCGSPGGAGLSCLHVAVGDNSRVAYAELLPDERKGTACGFMSRALAFYEGLGVSVERVMTDNGPAYRSGDFNALLEGRGVKHKYTRPFSPRQNGKVERMNRTLAQEWQYARAWESEGGEGLRPRPLPGALQLGPSAQRVRGPAPDVTHRRRKQRLGTQQLAGSQQVIETLLAIGGNRECIGKLGTIRVKARNALELSAFDEPENSCLGSIPADAYCPSQLRA